MSRAIVAKTGRPGVISIGWVPLRLELAPAAGQSAGSSLLESCGFVRATGRIAGAVRVRSGASQPPAVDDQVLFANGSTLEPAFEDLARSSGVPCLGRQARA